jgi:uncharacterized membrane-anchored protein YjiN (DUF445 family)
MSDKQRNRLGTASLVGAFAGFLVVELQPWLPLASVALFGGLSLKGLLEAFFEASLVGAFADWFAVTALFKDPLGLRLPHTNILAKNKDAIADAVPRFLVGFVTQDAIREELGKLDFASKAAEALSAGGLREELHAFLRPRAAELLASYSGPSKSEELRRLAGQILDFAAQRIDAPSLISGALAWAKKERYDARALEAIASMARDGIGRNQARLISLITPLVKRNAGWQGIFIGKGMVERFISGIQEELGDIKADKANELRRYVLNSVAEYGVSLSAGAAESSEPSRAARERLSASFRKALEGEEFRKGFEGFLAHILSRLGDDLSGEGGRFQSTLESAEASLGARLASDGELRARLNSLAASVLTGVIERGRLIEGITAYLAKLLRSTDDRYFVERIEGAVWNDLQYIRVNGAVVGGLVGLAIALVKAAVAA